MFCTHSGTAEPMSTTDESQPDETDESAVSVLEDFANEGWATNHIVRSDGAIECGACGEQSSADRWAVGAQHRIEGASDPDALQLIVGVSCPHCEDQGALVLGYGPNASTDESDVMLRFDLDEVPDPVAHDT